MNLPQIKEVIEREFRDKTLGVTGQYLEIHKPVYDSQGLVIERVDREKHGTTIAYIPVEDERFFFAVYLNAKEDQVLGLHTESLHRVYFMATSQELTSDDLKGMTILSPTETWSKGDLRKTSKMTQKFSALKILLNPEPDEFEDKLEKLLNFLEQDRNGVLRLSNEAKAFVSVVMNIHNENGMIGGPILSSDHIKRLAELKLAISFDMYLEGRPFL
jgi:hypothetical protein